MPSYLDRLNELKAMGVSDVIVVAVNDACVMSAWSKDTQAEGKLKFLADARSELAQALGVILDAPVILDKLGNARCKRFSLLVDNCIVREAFFEQEHNGQAGKKEDTFADNMLSRL